MVPAPAPEHGERIPALDGLRGLAVGLVVIGHYFGQVPFPADSAPLVFLRQLTGFFSSGVELFFVLSGYLIASILFARGNAANLGRVFYARRLCRTLPAYFLLLAAFFILRNSERLNAAWSAPEFEGTVPGWSYLLLIQNVYMAALRNLGPWWLAVTWSLAVEEQFYAFMPWLVRFTRPGLLLALAAASLVGCPLLRWFFLYRAANPFAALYLLPCRMDSLFLGAALAVLCGSPTAREWLRRHRAARRAALAVFAVGFFVGPFLLSPLTEIAVTSLPGLGFALILLDVLLEPGSRLCRLLGHPALLFLGGVSYFVYLFHLPVLYTVHGLLGARQPLHFSADSWLATAASLVVVLGLGACSRRWLELPFIRLGRRLRYAPRSSSN
ncbi:MAG TPA: acyltransferase [Opitutaceae bacterium]|nr:acyltransferase [Opitutaceae bacterium]